MNKRRRNSRFFAFFSIFIMVAIAFHPALDPVWDHVQSFSDQEYETFSSLVSASAVNSPKLFQSKPKQNVDISELNTIAEAKKDTDTDDDGIYDSVEKVIGSDMNANDSDFDGLDDWEELMIYETDPSNPDSNNDGLSDYNELYNISADIDADGIMNPWDVDNDNDGVTDDHDLSPFSSSLIYDHVDFDIHTNGNASFFDVQIRPKEKSHLTLSMQYWDWPEDDQGIMKDLNNSKEDVFILPYLEVKILTDFKLISKFSGNCLTVSNENLSENASIQQHVYSGMSNQNWSINTRANGYVSIHAAHSGKCIASLSGSNVDDTSSMVQQTFSGNDNQLWRLDPIGNNSYAIISKLTEQCIEVSNSSFLNDTSVQQSDFREKSHQIWLIKDVNEVIPDQEEVVSYGASVDLDTILVPLTPIWDMGVAPAFNGKMYFPPSNALDVSVESRLLWKVYGNTDTEQKTLIANNGRPVSANNTNDEVIANGTGIGVWETFEWVTLGPHRVGLKAYNGNFVTLTKKDGNHSISDESIDVLTASANEIGENETFKIVEKNNNANIIGLKASNGKYVSIQNSLNNLNQLSATSNTMGAKETFILQDAGYVSHATPLVSYYEDFQITGFQFQEQYASQVGCLYSTDLNQTIKAGFVAAYDFLRNQTDLSELSETIENRNITVNVSLESNVIHQDESVFLLMSELLPSSYQVLSNQSNMSIAPIIVVLQDAMTSVTLDDLTSTTFLKGNRIVIDVTDKPVISSKLFKMNWYNLTNTTMLSVEEVLVETMRWGLQLNDGDDQNNAIDNSSLSYFMGLFSTWNLGEYKISSVGNERIYYEIDEAPVVLNYLQYSFFGVSTAIDIINVIKQGSVEYRFLVSSAQLIKKLFAPLSRALKAGITAGLKALRLNKVAVKALNALKSLNRAIKASKAAQSIIKFFKSTKFVSFLDKLGTALILIDLAITGVIAFYMFWSILFDQGFSDFGAALGAWVVIFSFAYAGVYIVLALALPIIGIVLAILDMIFDFFGDLLELFLSWVTKTEERSKFNLGFIKGPELIKHDYDNNGFDVGDRIEFLAQMYGVVWKTNHGSWGDVLNSYVRPSLKLSVPLGSTTGGYNNKIATDTDQVSYRNETYDMGIWADPISMSNYPLTLQLRYEYKRFYNECVWFFGWWCDRESDSGVVTEDITTLYFDVLPGNLTAFLTWSEITPLDSDGDGLSNDDELSHASNPWRVDTDVDGLWDKFEIDNGLLPFSSDSDRDGVNDKIELEIGSDVHAIDTDADGLSDVEEYRGWDITFMFWDSVVSMHVDSDLLEVDSDNDGLTDLEEYMKGLNPCSSDTDADGILDPDEYIVPFQGLISSVDFNNRGSSICVKPNTSINTTISYRVKGIQCLPGLESSNCSLNLTIENDSGIIKWNKTIFLKHLNSSIINNNVTTFLINVSANISNRDGLYLMRYYIDWECFGIVPDEMDQREIIGIIDSNESTDGISHWECYDVTGGDTDGDMISNVHEQIGWMVNYTTETGTYNVHVTSDPGLVDTDADGEWDIWEHNCSDNSTNPRDPDTDDDGLTDWEEKNLHHTNPLHYDSDGDGLDDQTEFRYLSNPWKVDTDDDGLTDRQEFDNQTNPNHPDTDADGLSDVDEIQVTNSSPLLPDTDGDKIFDKKEFEIGTHPRNPDTDDDGLIDGNELLFNTNPKLPDTDFDNVTDFKEVYWGTNATDPDTDNDGLIDGDEFLFGTHPLLKDTDRDQVNDSCDEDTFAPHIDYITLAFDYDEDISEFKEHLDQYCNVSVVSIDQLLSDEYKNSSYIVLVGSLNAGDGTVGNLSKTILDDAGENTTAIIETGQQFFASKSSVWNETQTIVMLSQPFRLDHLIVLSMLKTMWKTVSNNSVHIQWPTQRTSFNVDVVNELGVMIWADLDQPAIPILDIARYNESTVSPVLTTDNGLGKKMNTAGLYIDIDTSNNLQNDTDEIIDEAWIIVYYTASDLDRNGDGDALDIGDVNEKALKLYYFDEKSNKWIAVTEKLDWVFETGIDSNNIELYGKTYEGYIWAHVSHFSLYGLAGPLIKEDEKPGPFNYRPVADASLSDRFGLVNVTLSFDATNSYDDGIIELYTWDFGDGNTGSGIKATHRYQQTGTYPVILMVTDNKGATDTDQFLVTISRLNNPPSRPIIGGNEHADIKEESAFTAVSFDVDPSDVLRYGWDWNHDDIVDEWTDDYHSGVNTTIYHGFSTAGFYQIRTVAEDSAKARSQWSEELYVFVDIGYQKQKDGIILIDYENDGSWDSAYDPVTESFVSYEISSSNLNLLIMILIFCVILLMSLTYIRKRKR